MGSFFVQTFLIFFVISYNNALILNFERNIYISNRKSDLIGILGRLKEGVKSNKHHNIFLNNMEKPMAYLRSSGFVGHCWTTFKIC